MRPVIEVVEELMMRRRWLLNEIRRFEERYGIDSRDFYEKWNRRLLPSLKTPRFTETSSPGTAL